MINYRVHVYKITLKSVSVSVSVFGPVEFKLNANPVTREYRLTCIGLWVCN